MAETTMSIMIVSVLMVVSLSTFAHVNSVSNRTNYDLRATELASFFLSECASCCFVTPEDPTSTSIGKETGESGPRENWDDCDDYHLLTLSSLTDASGNSLPDAAGWSGNMYVYFALPANPTVVSGSPTDMKLITLSLVDPSGKSHTFQTFRSRFGVLQAGGAADILSSIEVSAKSGSTRSISAGRVLNQQEP